MNLLARLLSAPLMERQIELQERLLVMLRQQLLEKDLYYTRLLRDIAVEFQLALADPEGGHEEKIEWALRDLNDQLARLQEYRA